MTDRILSVKVQYMPLLPSFILWKLCYLHNKNYYYYYYYYYISIICTNSDIT
jgi:hypothetical protein